MQAKKGEELELWNWQAYERSVGNLQQAAEDDGSYNKEVEIKDFHLDRELDKAEAELREEKIQEKKNKNITEAALRKMSPAKITPTTARVEKTPSTQFTQRRSTTPRRL